MGNSVVSYTNGANQIPVSATNPLPVTGISVTISHVVLDAGSAIAGKFGIDQTTPGTTNKVSVSNVSVVGYEAVAASATDQVLGGSGAAGDYLVRLMVQPASIAPGTIIIKDNATTIYTYPGTAAYDAGLAPFSVEIGANSASGAWKITTGANVSLVAVGNFT